DRLGNPISAYSFNGTNNYINLGNVAAARPTASVSVSIWFELNATGILSGRSMISCTENAGWAIHYLSNNTLEAVVRRNGSYGLVATPGTAYNNSGWHFACMTYDGRYLKLYLDGELKGTDDAGGNYPITYVANNTYIGADPTTGSGIDGNFYYKGKLDEAKIYSGALSAAEVLAEYQMNKPIPTLGLKLWLRADSGVNLSGNNVTQWNDLSGNNLNAIQGNSSKQPQWVANAMNGNPVVHFDGSDDILAASVLPLSSTNKATVIIVNKALNNGICVEQSRNVNSSAGGFYIYDNYQNNGWAAAVKGNAAGPFSNYVSTFISNTLSYAPKLIVASFDKSQGSYQNQIKSRMNGTDMVNASGYGGTHTDNFVNDTLFIGGRQTGNAYLEGDIAEILVYNRLLSTTERNQVENYINQKYNVGGALAQHAPGSGNAIQLDGVNDYISVPSPSFTAYTAEAWVKFNGSTQNKNIMVFTGGVATATWSHQIRTNSSGAFQHYSFDGSQNTVTSSTPIQSGVWYHVCITGQNNGMLRLYVNGKEKGTPISVGTLWTPGTQFQIGTATGNGMGIPNMEIDEIRVWNTALTESQIQQRMCRKITNTDALYNRLVFALNADELTGTTLYDASPNGRN
ncbi:MAG TPA: LamG domain-containing protein, partial [Chitinophagaceae bacterium]|nr:LamG domain-containing protein [Chitinophagaceae bacterium]